MENIAMSNRLFLQSRQSPRGKSENSNRKLVASSINMQNKIIIKKPFCTLSTQLKNLNKNVADNSEPNQHPQSLPKSIKENINKKMKNHTFSKRIKVKTSSFDNSKRDEKINLNLQNNQNSPIHHQIPININIQNVNINNYYNFYKHKKEENFPLIRNYSSGQKMTTSSQVLPNLKNSNNNIILTNNNINVVNIINNLENLNSSEFMKKLTKINNNNNNNINNNNNNNMNNINNNNNINNITENDSKLEKKNDPFKSESLHTNSIEAKYTNTNFNSNINDKSNVHLKIKSLDIFQHQSNRLNKKKFPKFDAFKTSATKNISKNLNPLQFNYYGMINGNYNKDNQNNPIKMRAQILKTETNTKDKNLNLFDDNFKEKFFYRDLTTKTTENLDNNLYNANNNAINTLKFNNNSINNNNINTINNSNNNSHTLKNNKKEIKNFIFFEKEPKKNIEFKDDLFQVEDSFIDELNVLISGVEDKKEKNSNEIKTEQKEEESLNDTIEIKEFSEEDESEGKNITQENLERIKSNIHRPGTSYGGLKDRLNKLKYNKHPNTCNTNENEGQKRYRTVKNENDSFNIN